MNDSLVSDCYSYLCVTRCLKSCRFHTCDILDLRDSNTTSEMWDLDTKDLWSYFTFMMAFGAFMIYAIMASFIFISLIYGKLYLHKPSHKAELGDEVPGVTIIKPLMGVDVSLVHNLESHFRLNYPKFELLFCFHDDQDSAIPVVYKLCEQFPHVDVKLFIGGDESIINPMVQNMAPAYDKAQYDYVWISSGRVEASDIIIYDLASKLQRPHVSLVHQIPFTTDCKGFGNTVEKIYFGSAMSRFYITLNALGLNCVTGMSYMFKKPLLDQMHGLAWYGKYLAEDFVLTANMHEKGVTLMSAIPCQQNVGHVTVCGFKGRMVRWVRLRLNMMPAVTGVLEPLSECLPLGLWMAWVLHYFFDLDPFVFFFLHVLGWMVLDYWHVKVVQNGKLPFSKLEFVMAWIVRELSATYVFLEALVDPHTIKWGKRTYRVKYGGLTDIVQDTDNNNDKKDNNNDKKSLHHL